MIAIVCVWYIPTNANIIFLLKTLFFFLYLTVLLNDIEMEINLKILQEKCDKKPFIRLKLELLQNWSLYWT